MADAIVTERLTKLYGTKKVVDNLSLKIPEGCVYGFLGRNGAGKSTTLKMLVNMVQPDFGSIWLGGFPLAQLPEEKRARIAYLAEGHPLYPWMTVRQALDFTCAFYKEPKRRLVEQILDHFALSLNAKIRWLSKGQLAQVSLALSLAADPNLLILDDPTLGLDTNVRRDFLESMIQLIQKQGRTILFSSHVLGDVERVADRIGVLIDGVLRVDCPTEHFKTSVRKVIVEFGREPPKVPTLEGLLGDWLLGTRRELVFVGFGPKQRAALEALSPKEVEVQELNLEDAFIEYTRGPRRALPFLLEEGTHGTSTGIQGVA